MRPPDVWSDPEELPQDAVARTHVMRERAQAMRAQSKAMRALAARMVQDNRIAARSRPTWVSKSTGAEG
jgi:hypothetical protein